MEFKFNGPIVRDYQPITWCNGYPKKIMGEDGGLYMNLTFVEVLEKKGLDAPVASFAKAFANTGYCLWHSNQAARYNILHGIAPPQPGHWPNNPHADGIDYEIEAEFAGPMSPGVPNAASALSDKVGHLMNYGGVYMGALYTLAFTSDNVPAIV